MKRLLPLWIGLIVIAISPHNLQAQETDSLPQFRTMPYSEKFPILIEELQFGPSHISIYGNGLLNSQALTGSFYKPWYQGGKITDEIKEEVDDRLGLSNTVGFDLEYGVRYARDIDSFCKATPVTFYLDFSDRQHGDLTFTDRFFNLAMRGNKVYEGDSVQLADVQGTQFRYQYLKAGLLFQTNNLAFGGGLGFVKGEQLQRVDVSNARLYTAPFGTAIELEADLENQRSDTARTGIGAFNGWGLGADLLFEYRKSNWGSLLLEVRDLGFINWNDQTIHTEVDSMYLYEGVEVPGFNELIDSVYLQDATDSIADIYTNFQRSKKTFRTYLPARIHLQYARFVGEKLVIFSGVQHRLAANYSPYFYLKGRYEWKNANFWAQFGYGGYGKTSVGFGGLIKLSKQFYLELGSQHLEGLIASKSSGGLQAFGRLTMLLGNKK